MKTQNTKVENWYRSYQLIAILGYILCLGSIFVFIVMNSVMGQEPSMGTLSLHRQFVTGISHVLIIPGIVFLFTGSSLISWQVYGFFSKRWVSVVQVSILLIIVNSICIVVLGDKINNLVNAHSEISQMLTSYKPLKSREDIMGAVNLMLLLVSLIVPIYNLRK